MKLGTSPGLLPRGILALACPQQSQACTRWVSAAQLVLSVTAWLSEHVRELTAELCAEHHWVKYRSLFLPGPAVAETSYLPHPLWSPCATCSLHEGCRRRRRPFSALQLGVSEHG